MAVVKLNSRGSSFHFIDESGNVFVTSKYGIDKLSSGEWTGTLTLLRLPNPVPADKFKPSPVWQPSSGSVIPSSNAYDPKVISDNIAKLAYSDRVVD